VRFWEAAYPSGFAPQGVLRNSQLPDRRANSLPWKGVALTPERISLWRLCVCWIPRSTNWLTLGPSSSAYLGGRVDCREVRGTG